jgi:hypothetical protein
VEPSIRRRRLEIILQPLKLDTACSKRTKKHMSNQWLLWHSHTPMQETGRLLVTSLFFPSHYKDHVATLQAQV